MAVWLEVIAEAGGAMNERLAYSRFLGRSLANGIHVLKDEFGLILTPEHLSLMQTRLYDRLHHELRPIPGVSKAIRRLTSRYCVASSSQMDRIQLSLSVTGLLDHFESNIYSSSAVQHGKPAPDLFLHAASSMGTESPACVVIEDSASGILAAKRAGMRVCAFTGGSHAGPAGLRETVSALDPDAVFDDMRELPDLLLRLEKRGRRE